MYLNYLSLQNFKSISEKQLSFNKINLIAGKNGAGKTSILEAIIGSFIDHWELKLEEYVKRGTNKFEIKSNFNFYDKLFEYEIEYDKGTKRKLSIDQNKTLFQSDCVTELRQYINPTIALFSNVSLQGDSIQILKEKPTPRLEKLKQIFNIKNVDESIEKIKFDIEEVKKNILEKETLIASLRSQKFIYQEIPEKINYINLELQIKDLEIKKLSYENELKKYENYIKQEREYQNYITDKEFSETSLQRLEEQLSEINNKLIDKSEDVLNNEISKYKDNKNVLEQNKNLYEKNITKILQLKNELKKYEKEKNEIILKRILSLSFSEEEYINYYKNFQDVSNELYSIENKYKAIKEGKCPTCGAEYSSDEINIYEIKIIELKNTKENLENLIKKHDEEKKQFEKINQENKLAEQKRNSINRIIENINKQIDDLNIEIKEYNIDEIEQTLNILNKTILEKIELLNNIKEINKLKDGVEKEIIKFKTTLENFKIIEKPKEIIEPEIFIYAELENLQKKLNIACEREKEIKRIEEFNEKIKKEESDIIKKIAKNEDELSKQRQKLTLLESSKKILSKEFISYLIDKGTNFIKNKMNDLFQRSYDKPYEIFLKKEGVGVDFYYTDKTNILSPVRAASGYEKQLLSVTFRLALASLHKLGIFIFDEIDSDSSEENSLRLYKTILNQKFSQLFVVTHKEVTKDYLLNLNECKLIEM